MAKIFLFSLFFCALQTGFTPIFAANGHASFESVPPKMNGCDAPPPDSFRVTNTASDLVTLGWTPAWAGAIHTLEISIEDSGIWITTFTNYNVSGGSYTLNNLEPGYYRARIATNCSTGETSFKVAEVIFEFKIIDLTTAGRIPENPVPVENCTAINYLNHKWVGYQVREIGTNNSNIFEIELVGSPFYDHALVKRVYDNSIVAVNNLGLAPINGGLPYKVMSPFRMDDKSKPNPNIGYIEFNKSSESSDPPIIRLCNLLNDPTKPWKPSYEFTALTAEGIIIDYPNDPHISNDKGESDSIKHDKFKAQSPFNESLVVYLPGTHSEINRTIFRLFNSNGQVVLRFDFDLNNSSVSFPTTSLIPGIYFLQIETKDEINILRVIKHG